MTDEAARAIALQLKWSMTDVRSFIDDLEHQGVHITFAPTTGELCPCGYHYATPSGLCVKCETDREVERQQEEDEAEEARLAEETERRLNNVKKARERMRKRFLANPRDKGAKEMLGAVDEFIALMEHDDDGFDREEDLDAAAEAAMHETGGAASWN